MESMKMIIFLIVILVLSTMIIYGGYKPPIKKYQRRISTYTMKPQRPSFPLVHSYNIKIKTSPYTPKGLAQHIRT
jgi:hypothetical protein